MQLVLSLLHPSLGKLAEAHMDIMAGNAPGTSASNNAVEPFAPIHMKNFVSYGMRRQIVKTMLLVIRKYSFCSIACQLSIMLLDTIKTLFDVIDIV